jgi:hypothetical protein
VGAVAVSGVEIEVRTASALHPALTIRAYPKQEGARFRNVQPTKNRETMNNNALKLLTLALMPATMLIFTSCSTTMEGEETETLIETKDGAMVVDTFTMTATVTAIDANKRKLTLTTPDGKKNTFKAGKNINLDQIRIGERITVTATEEVAVFLRKPGTPTSVGEGGTVAVAARGNEADVLTAETQEVTAKVTALDVKHHKVTLQFVDGTTKKFKVGKRVNLADVKVGDDVTVQIAEALAVDVQK